MLSFGLIHKLVMIHCIYRGGSVFFNQPLYFWSEDILYFNKQCRPGIIGRFTSMSKNTHVRVSYIQELKEGTFIQRWCSNGDLSSSERLKQIWQDRNSGPSFSLILRFFPKLKMNVNKYIQLQFSQLKEMDEI